MKLIKRFYLTIALPILASLILTACGAVNFAKAVTNILDASDPFVESLPLPDSVKLGLIVDFKDLARGAAVLGTEIDACAKSKPCALTAVDKYAVLFDTVYRRGHLGVNNPQVQRVVSILRGLIASAKIYYGLSGIGGGPTVTKDDIDRQVKSLKDAMKVR